MEEIGWLKKILAIIPEIKVGILNGTIIAFFYEGIKFIPVIILKYIVDYFASGQGLIAQVALAIGAILTAYVVLGVIDYFSHRAAFRWNLQYETAILRKAKKKLLELHVGYHEEFNTGTQVSKITKGAHRLAELVWFAFEEFIPTAVQLIITLFLLLYEQWLLAVLFAVFTPLIFGITFLENKRVQPLRRRYHQKYDEAVGELGESILNIATVKDYVQEQRQFQKFNSLLGQYASQAMERFDYSHRLLLWRDIFIVLGRVTTLGAAAFLVISGKLSPGGLVLVYTLTERAFLATLRIGRLYSYLGDAMESINRLTTLLRESPAITDSPSAQTVRTIKREIEFKEIVFSYGQEKGVLQGISLQIKPREVVALVGKSGSGKTTITKLLLRNYDPKSGEILVDGVNIKSYKMGDYKKRIAVVSQNVEIFNRSILENIRFAKPTASKEEIIAAAKKAHAHQFVMEFPEGYDTIVGEKGIRLSGGQKQRVSIARALLKDPDIFIFDEATSSLDTEAEQYIQKSIFSIAGQKTTIIIAHRLSTIRRADLILVMDKGRIKERGTYEQLLRQKGLFWKMVELQELAELRD